MAKIKGFHGCKKLEKENHSRYELVSISQKLKEKQRKGVATRSDLGKLECVLGLIDKADFDTWMQTGRSDVL